MAITNREWLESLSDEELALKLRIGLMCNFCINGKDNNCGANCNTGIIQWLKAKRGETKK